MRNQLGPKKLGKLGSRVWYDCNFEKKLIVKDKLRLKFLKVD